MILPKSSQKFPNVPKSSRFNCWNFRTSSSREASSGLPDLSRSCHHIDLSSVISVNLRLRYLVSTLELHPINHTLSPVSHISMAHFIELFGDKLLTQEGEKDTAEVIGDAKNIMIYFSAHWCPPCRGYTPQLSDAYAASAKAGKETVCIFVSSDRDQAAADSYFATMSFCALPYANRAKKDELSKKFEVRGIPTLILLDSAGVSKGNIRGGHDKYL